MSNQQIQDLKRNAKRTAKLGDLLIKKIELNYQKPIKFGQNKRDIIGKKQVNKSSFSQLFQHYKSQKQYKWSAYKFKTPYIQNQKISPCLIRVSTQRFEIQGQHDYDFDKVKTVFIQTRQQFNELNDKKLSFLNLKVNLQEQRRFIDGSLLNQINIIQNKIVYNFPQIFQTWHQQSKFRIIVLVKDNKFIDRNLFIYNQISGQRQNDQTSQFMLNLFISHYLKNTIFKQNITNEGKKSLLIGLKNSFTEKIQQQKLKNKKKLLTNKQLQKHFKQYQTDQLKPFLSNWYQKSNKFTTSHLYVEVDEIWISKQKQIQQVRLNIQSITTAKHSSKKVVSNQKQSQQKIFKFKRVTQKFIIYTLDNQQKNKCYKFNLKDLKQYKKLNFNLQINDKKDQKFSNQFLYVHSQTKQLFLHQLTLNSKQIQIFSQQQTFDCIIYFTARDSRNSSLLTLKYLNNYDLFQTIGHIPTKYRSFLKINYNPQNYFLIKKLVAPSLSDELNSQNYFKCYQQLVKFMQKQQNESQMSVANIKLSQITDKCPMKYRYIHYRTIFKRYLLSKFDKKQQITNIQKFFISKCKQLKTKTALFEVQIPENFLKMLKQDIIRMNLKHEQTTIISAKHYLNIINKIDHFQQFPYRLTYNSQILKIIYKFSLIQSNINSDDSQSRKSKLNSLSSQDQIDQVYVLILFLAKLYPYADKKILQNDLFILRWLVQKKLPYFNDFLNRNHIGLQNLISKYLLSLFTDLSDQLCFRIWDFMMYYQHSQKARIIVAFTLLTYFETTENFPIIPIYQFMQNVYKNIQNISVSIQFAQKFKKSSQTITIQQINKDNQLQLLFSKNQNLLDDVNIQKLLFGSKDTNNKKNNLSSLPYPIPKQRNTGHKIKFIYLFLHNLHILDILDFSKQHYIYIRAAQKLQHQDQYIYDQQISYQKVKPFLKERIINKNHFYNKPIEISWQQITKIQNQNYYKHQLDGMTKIIIDIIRIQNNKPFIQLEGYLDLGTFSKDKIYKINVPLKTIKHHHNKGQTSINVSICLKSNIFKTKQPRKQYNSLQNLSQKVLDYDIGQSCVSQVQVQKLLKIFQQMKKPLDQFQQNQYNRLRISSLNFFQAQWINNSKITLQQLKSIFEHVYSGQKNEQTKRLYYKIFQIFGTSNKLQYVYLSQILTKIILNLQISRKKKITYLYCLCVHYQGNLTTKITSQTLNSLIRLIFLQNQQINACPYLNQTCGKIVQAYYFQSIIKNTSQKRYFTQIAQDWLYISTFKHEFNSIILGTAIQLKILKSLFDAKTLSNIQKQPQCRFQIIYQINKVKYIWSAVIDTKTFSILNRGTKFLNSYDTYSSIPFLNSTQQSLYNNQNTITMQNLKLYNYDQFSKVLYQNQLIRYYLQQPSLFQNHLKNKRKIKILPIFQDKQFQDYQEGDKSSLGHKQQSQFCNSWATYRGQNCLQTKKKCQILKSQQYQAQVRFVGENNIRTVNKMDLISLEEINSQK